MKKWIISNKLYFIGALLGGLAGFLYWKYVGCLTGTCAITSKPLNSTLYFAFFGAVLLSFFKKEKTKNQTGQ
jgi:uncharacterized membrane protein YdjX (TVP38/TMEM64 family)